jgi:hypothetical protein
MFYVYIIDDSTYVKIGKVNKISIGKTIDVTKMAYWESKKNALSWESVIKKKYPKAQLKEAVLTILK